MILVFDYYYLSCVKYNIKGGIYYMNKKLISVLLAVVMMASLLVGCGNGENKGTTDTAQNQSNEQQGTTVKENDGNEEGDSDVPDYLNPIGYPITKEKITITAMGLKNPGSTDWGELEIMKKAEEVTNIHFEFQLAEASTYQEKKNLALASGEYPDVFLRDMSITDEEKYGSQGIFIDLTPLIEKYAPNLQKRMEEHPDIKSAITSLNGKIYGLPAYIRTSTQNPWTTFMDAGWMEAVGKTMPQTVDDLYELLKAYKVGDPNGNGDPNDEIPWGGVGLYNLNFICAAFTGLAGGMGFDVQEDGTVVYTPALPVFKEFLKYANKLYTEGLIDPELFVQTSQQHLAKVKSGIVGIYNISPTSLPPETKTLQDSLEPLTSDFNSKKVAPAYQPVSTGKGVITDKCKYPEAVMRWFDMWYADIDEGVGEAKDLNGVTLFLGFEGQQWEYADEQKQTYRWIEPVRDFQSLREEAKITLDTGLPAYLNFMPYPADFPLMEMKVKAVQTRQEPYLIDRFPSTVRYTTEETERISLLETDITNYMEEIVSKFITGEEPIDNFDKYIQTLDEIGLKELLEIKQKAYDRWAQASK